ncbi:putative AMP-dependent synthetase/ligase domain-containing protein [Seiridium cardinale]
MTSNSLSYSLADVLAIARVHPFYSDAQYPPNKGAICEATNEKSRHPKEADLSKQPLLFKKELYVATERLIHDTSPDNTYRHNAYVSVTGGGGNLQPLCFLTDASENRRQRSQFGQFLRTIGMIKDSDWVLTMHVGGDLYRSLDLILEILGNAGATVVPAGHLMSPKGIVQLLQDFHINVLAGDGSQIIQIVHYLSSLTGGRQGTRLVLDKIIYTSEALTVAQKAYICAVLGRVRICSVLGSAEAGPYGASYPDLGTSGFDAHHTDFVIDKRLSLIEIFPLSVTAKDFCPAPLPEGETGLITLTSLARLRNPVVRYVTGDVGSLHPLPEKACMTLPEADLPHMSILRLQGRDSRFSFAWDGEYIEMEKLNGALSDANLAIVQWQAVLDRMVPSNEASLEIRLLCPRSDENNVFRDSVVAQIRSFFYLNPTNSHRFKITFVKDRNEFELSPTGRKVVKFINRFN